MYIYFFCVLFKTGLKKWKLELYILLVTAIMKKDSGCFRKIKQSILSGLFQRSVNFYK